MTKKKKILIGVAAVALLGIAYGQGTSAASAELEGDRIKADDLAVKITDAEAEYEKLTQDIEAATEELAGQEESLAALAEFKEREAEFEELSGKLATLDGDIESREATLEKLDSAVALKAEEPVSLSAGSFIVGSDVEAGRYTAKEGSSNFVVYDASGGLKVNTILGGSHGVPEFVFFAEVGDVIESNSPVKLYPTE